MRLSTLVPVGSFVLAIAVSWLMPSTRGLVRADGEATGCTVVTTVNGSVEVKSRTVGDDSIRDEKKKDIKKELGTGLSDLGVDPTDDQVDGTLDSALKDIQKNKLDAYCVTCIDASFTWVQNVPTRVDATVTAKFCVSIVLPKNAGEVLKAHEAGHKLIADLTKDWSKKKFKDEMDKAACNQESMDAAFAKALAAADALLEAANKDYDAKTNHGKIGDAAAQLTQAAASFAAAAAN